MEMKNKSSYEMWKGQEVDPKNKTMVAWIQQIGRDVPRTHLYDRKTFQQRKLGKGPHIPIDREALTRVLVAFCHFAPHIGYIQGLDQIAAFLLHITTEENAFWILCGLTCKFLPHGHFDALLLEHMDALMLRLLNRDPKLHARLEAYGGLTIRWFGTLFVNVVSLETTVTIWDAMFDAGSPTHLEEIACSILCASKTALETAKDENIPELFTDMPLADTY